jgi:hypothetical protein
MLVMKVTLHPYLGLQQGLLEALTSGPGALWVPAENTFWHFLG